MIKVKPHTLRGITFSIAVIGLIITIAGNFFDVSITKKLCYLIGALVLLLAAILEKNTFFSILETILSIGAAIAFLPISPSWKSGTAIILGILAAIYLAISGKLKDRLTLLSIASILLCTWGYALSDSRIYFWAGLITTIYSFCAFNRGERIALAFGILNSIFTITALFEINKIYQIL